MSKLCLTCKDSINSLTNKLFSKDEDTIPDWFKDLRMTSLGSAPHLSETNAASKENGVLAAWSRSADHHARHLTDASGAGGHHRAPGGQGYQQRGEIGHRFCRSQGMLPLTRFCPETLANHTYAHFPSDRQKRSRLLSRHVQPAPHPR